MKFDCVFYRLATQATCFKLAFADANCYVVNCYYVNTSMIQINTWPDMFSCSPSALIRAPGAGVMVSRRRQAEFKPDTLARVAVKLQEAGFDFVRERLPLCPDACFEMIMRESPCALRISQH